MKKCFPLLLLSFIFIIEAVQAQEPIAQFIEQNGAEFTNQPHSLIAADQNLFFVAETEEHGEELWVSDGTPEGTVMVKDIYVGSGSSQIVAMTYLSAGRIVFIADDNITGDEIWVSDGTPEGTFLTKNISLLGNGITKRSSGVFNTLDMINVDGIVYFPADVAGSGFQELWRTDGTEMGTYKAGDGCEECSTNSGELSWFVLMNDELYFFGLYSMYKYDFTDDGTVEVFRGGDPDNDIPPFISTPFAYQNDIYFGAWDDIFGSWQFWKSDGTENGTVLVKYLYPQDPDINEPYHHIIFQDMMYFVGNGKLYKSDGTNAGTVPFGDFDNMETGNGIKGAPLYIWNNQLYFCVSLPYSDIWRTSGNAEDAEFVIHSGNILPHYTESENHLWVNQGWNGSQQSIGAIGLDGIIHDTILLEPTNQQWYDASEAVFVGDKTYFSGQGSGVVGNRLMYSNPAFLEYNQPAITGTAFADLNENGIFDSEEYPLVGIKISDAIRGVHTFTDEFGNYYLQTNEGAQEISVTNATNCFSEIMPETVYYFSINAGEVEELNIGLKKIDDGISVETFLSSGTTRCGFTVPFKVSTKNDGCEPISGELSLIIDEYVTFAEFVDPPDVLTDSTATWFFTDLEPTAVMQPELLMTIADASSLGEYMHLKAETKLIDENNETYLVHTFNFTSQINCAYDPNDKTVQPDRTDTYDENYTLIGENLLYTIRFQNTGTDTAFNVVIRDSLDILSFNLNSFRPIAASHPYRSEITEEGFVAFYFDDILLPDSTTNLVASQGFISFALDFYVGLPEYHVGENRAGIYFDFNPPIITNTARSVLVSELPTSVAIANENSKNAVKIHPNPFENTFTLSINQGFDSQSVKLLTILDTYGKIVSKYKFIDNETQIVLRNIPAGLYFYQLEDLQSGALLSQGKLISSQ